LGLDAGTPSGTRFFGGALKHSIGVASSEGHVWCGRLEAAAALSWHFQPRSEVEIAFKLENQPLIFWKFHVLVSM
jgi:hypothetical protein